MLAPALLVAIVALPLALDLLGAPEPPELRTTPPYAVPSALGTTRVGESWDPSRDAGGAAALLYVSQPCPWCRVEMTNWASLHGEIPLWIVASPGSELEALDWVPARLRARVVSDADGAIAEALGVPAVPVTLWIDAGGMVRDQRLGASSPKAIRQEWRTLVAPSTPEAAPPIPLTDTSDPGGGP